jgi:hypothetical protein
VDDELAGVGSRGAGDRGPGIGGTARPGWCLLRGPRSPLPDPRPPVAHAAFPSAAGGVARPTTPASATMVST